MELLAKFLEFMRSRQDPHWLSMFRRYYEEGVLEECPGTCTGETGDDSA